MDVGIFITSSRRLTMWIIIPPLLMVGIGMGSFAWKQKAQWQLQEAQALSELLPPFITARNNAAELFKGFETDAGGELGSEDQLISFLQDMAQQNSFMVETVNIVARKNPQQTVPALNAVVKGEGDFTAVQLYINEAKSKQRLLSVDSIKVMEPNTRSETGLYSVEIIFELLLIDEIKALGGGSQ